jgi:hypothetical protein
MISLRIISKSLSETHSISANVEFPWLVGRFLPARHSGAAKICFIPGQITLYSTRLAAENKPKLGNWRGGLGTCQTLGSPNAKCTLGDLKMAARMAKSRLARHPTATREFGVFTRLNECLGDFASTEYETG